MYISNKSIDRSQLRILEKFGSSMKKFGVNFAVCNAEGELVLLYEGGRFESSREQLKQLGKMSFVQACEEKHTDDSNTPVVQFCEAERILAICLGCADFNDGQTPVAAALLELGENSSAHTNNLSCNKKDKNPAQDDRDYFAEMLRLLAREFQTRSKTDEEIEKISTELARVYEELVLLHKISTNMRVTELDSNFLQMACDSLTEVVLVEGIAILLEKTIDDQQQMAIAAGSGLIDIDEQMATVLYNRLIEEINKGKESLLDSEVDSPFRYDWPGSVKNIIAVPLCRKEKNESHVAGKSLPGSSIIGLMVAINRIGKRDFDSTDVKLFNSVASGCAVFIENGRLFQDLKELFIGSLKALTSSIDAKDKYTHGHSERVAFISRWIAEKLSEKEPLGEEQIHQIYLSGLLHDIGKIGIDEAVLRKEGKLTEQEYACIKVHPSIGAGILREIKQMREIVPGVLCHHERVDGRGYPSGLVGEQIPLAGKIVGLADSFDAMTSKRTYRDAMTVEQALTEIEKGLGTQFDEKLGRIFLESDIYQLWDSIRDDCLEILQGSASAEYGAAAVETLIG